MVFVVVGIAAGCSSFESSGTGEDAGVPPVDGALPVEDAAPDKDTSAPAEDAADAAPVPFCKLAENSKLGTFCDDFDDNPTKPQLLGWSRLQETGATLSYNGTALSAPFAMTATVPKGSAYARAFAIREEPAGNRFHLRFHVMGDIPPPVNAPLYLGHVTINGLYMISLRAFGDGSRLRMGLTKLGPTNLEIPAPSIDRAPELGGGKWIQVDMLIDDKASTYTVTMGGKSATGNFPDNAFTGKVTLRLMLGIEAYNAPSGSIAQDTTLHYDNVVIEAER